MPEEIKLFYMAADPATPIERRPLAGLMQGNKMAIEEEFLDGPISTRVAVIDIDPDDGNLVAGVPFSPRKGRTMATYKVRDPNDITARDFQQVSVFGAIHTVMEMFEKKDVLGRRLNWAFDGPQLLVVPRAGRMANAFYHRASRSLQFFFFDGVIGDQDTTVYTCLSPDIVAHETAHAILDGIAPDLYDATSPQSLGLHEAISDTTAMLFAAQSKHLTKLVLKKNGGDLRRPGAFNAIAEQFGRARSGRIQPLRDLINDRTMKSVVSQTPHALSEVLTGALYGLFLEIFEREMKELLDEQKPPPEKLADQQYKNSGRLLFSVSRKLRRIAFRALDYLPPGEISFADYARALIAADMVSNPNSHEERDIFSAECLRRNIVAQPDDLQPVAPGFSLARDTDLQNLLEDDAAAQAFAERHRASLFVPDGAGIDVRPRLDVTKSTWRKTGKKVATRELIFKLAWHEQEFITDPSGTPEPVDVIYGTTVSIGWKRRNVRAVVTTSRIGPHGRAQDRKLHDRMRSGFLRACLDDGTIDLKTDATRLPDGSWRIRGLGQHLHMAGR